MVDASLLDLSSSLRWGFCIGDRDPATDDIGGVLDGVLFRSIGGPPRGFSYLATRYGLNTQHATSAFIAGLNDRVVNGIHFSEMTWMTLRDSAYGDLTRAP